MITNANEVKAMTKHISCDCKCKFNSTICNSSQKWNNIKHVNVNVNIIGSAKKIIVGICGKSKYLKHIANASVTECDEIVIVMNIVST